MTIQVAGLDDNDHWVLTADTKSADDDVMIVFEQSDMPGPFGFVPRGGKLFRGDKEQERSLIMERSTFLMNVLNVRNMDNVPEVLAGAAERVSLACDIDEAFIVSDPWPEFGYEMKHELSPRVPVTGVARSTISGRDYALELKAFGTNNPNVERETEDDHVDLTEATETDHGVFRLAYPASWFLRPAKTPDGRAAWTTFTGGNACATVMTVDLFEENVDEHVAEIRARHSAPMESFGGLLRPKPHPTLECAGETFLFSFEHDGIDGLCRAGLFVDGDRCAAVRTFVCAAKTNPRRQRILRDADVVAKVALESFAWSGTR